MLARRTWPQRPKFVQGSLEPVENLAPLPSPFLSGVFLNVILRISPFFLWCLSFSFSSLRPLPWASLDAFVMAGSLPFWCVLGRLCRSWEHLCFLLSLLLFSSSPPPSFLARGVFTSKLGFCNRFLNEVWTVIGLSPFIWFPFHPPPQTFFPSFLSCPSEQSAKGRRSRFFKNEQFACSLKKRYQSQKRYLAL